jgi:cold shock CspA family protein
MARGFLKRGEALLRGETIETWKEEIVKVKCEKKKKQGRQRISTEFRQSGRHYFAVGGTGGKAATRRRKGSDVDVSRASTNCLEVEASESQSKVELAASESQSKVELAPAAKVIDSSLPVANTTDQTNEYLDGRLKSYHNQSGYGFVISDAVPQDIFLSRAELPEDRRVEPGRPCSFVLARDSKGRPQAQQVVWHEPIEANGRVSAGPYPSKSDERRFQGRIKSMGEEYGFIESDEVYGLYRRDVYVSRQWLTALGWKCSESGTHQRVSFAVELNAKGQPQAQRIVLEIGEGAARAEHEKQGDMPKEKPNRQSVASRMPSVQQLEEARSPSEAPRRLRF